MINGSFYRAWDTVTTTCINSTCPHKLLIDSWCRNCKSVNHVSSFSFKYLKICVPSWRVKTCWKVSLRVHLSNYIDFFPEFIGNRWIQTVLKTFHKKNVLPICRNKSGSRSLIYRACKIYNFLKKLAIFSLACTYHIQNFPKRATLIFWSNLYSGVMKVLHSICNWFHLFGSVSFLFCLNVATLENDLLF